MYINLYHDDNIILNICNTPPPQKKERHWVSSFIVPMQFPVWIEEIAVECGKDKYWNRDTCR